MNIGQKKRFPVIFGRYMGAYFHYNGSRVLNPVRKKGPGRLVTKPTKMTLLLAITFEAL